MLLKASTLLNTQSYVVDNGDTEVNMKLGKRQTFIDGVHENTMPQEKDSSNLIPSHSYSRDNENELVTNDGAVKSNSYLDNNILETELSILNKIRIIINDSNHQSIKETADVNDEKSKQISIDSFKVIFFKKMLFNQQQIEGNDFGNVAQIKHPEDKTKQEKAEGES